MSDYVTCPHCGEVTHLGGLIGSTTDDCPKCGETVLNQSESNKMKNYIVLIEKDEDIFQRDFVEIDAFSSSEAQAYAFDDLKENERIVSVWERVL